MNVLCRLPEFGEKGNIIFPNAEVIPVESWAQPDPPVLSSKEDVENFALIQSDIFELLKRMHTHLDSLAIKGDAVFFYKPRTTIVRGSVSAITRPHLFTFGIITCTPDGESKLNVRVETRQRIYIDCHGFGIAARTAEAVLPTFPWKATVTIKITETSALTMLEEANTKSGKVGKFWRQFDGFTFKTPSQKRE
jgi:hypothetical protein